MQHEESLLAVLDKRAEAEPGGVPFCYLADGEQEEQPLTYQAFESKAKALAASLQAEGLKGSACCCFFRRVMNTWLPYLAAFTPG